MRLKANLIIHVVNKNIHVPFPGLCCTCPLTTWKTKVIEIAFAWFDEWSFSIIEKKHLLGEQNHFISHISAVLLSQQNQISDPIMTLFFPQCTLSFLTPVFFQNMQQIYSWFYIYCIPDVLIAGVILIF